MGRLRLLQVEKRGISATVIRLEDGTALSYIIVRPKNTTPLIGVVALEQMGFRVDLVALGVILLKRISMVWDTEVLKRRLK